MIEATEALVFLIVALNSHWKIPVGYFLIHGLTAEEKANVLKTIICNIYDTGAIIKTLDTLHLHTLHLTELLPIFRWQDV